MFLPHEQQVIHQYVILLLHALLLKDRRDVKFNLNHVLLLKQDFHYFQYVHLIQNHHLLNDM
jgi:hypothetical protein